MVKVNKIKKIRASGLLLALGTALVGAKVLKKKQGAEFNEIVQAGEEVAETQAGCTKKAAQKKNQNCCCNGKRRRRRRAEVVAYN
jgi:hypothetical protein